MIVQTHSPAAPSKGLLVEFMTEASADEAISVVLCPSPGISLHSLYFRANADEAGVGITGSATIESNSNPSDEGGWAPVGSALDLSTIEVPSGELTGEELVQLTGIFVALRVRIDTIVAGGTLSVRYKGSNS